MSRGWSYRDIRDYKSSSRQRIISTKYPSDTEYDVPFLSTRPDASYYGRNFKNSEKGRSSSFALGGYKEPKMLNPYVKRPQPYPPNVVKDYNAYKEYDEGFTRAKARYNDTQPHNVGKKDVAKEMEGRAWPCQRSKSCS
ncbi:hypothetical protein PHISCL_00233 [Aspergillus sclerotialis]|uniref:Uncharacterized protein n=1 Tax=Aspergillus sclerotialis TaxID=2070753 RepID=A0A3A2ZWH0_9EURO|nr:hypothetical protein PHISCL_00233 [Aspergillus sclerotialis]